MRVCVCVYYVRSQHENGLTDLHQTWHAYSLRPGWKHRKGKTGKSVLSSSPGEDGFSSSETKHDRMTQRKKLFVSARRLQEPRSQTRKLSCVRVSVRMGLGIMIIIIFPMIFNDTYRMVRPMISFRIIKTGKKWKHLSNFPAVTLRALC
jgi:hypothetical protein